MNIRNKIAFFFGGLVSILLFILGITIYVIAEKERNSHFHTRLKNRAIATINTVNVITDSNYEVLKKIDAASIASLQNKNIIILDYRGDIAYNYADIPGTEITLTRDIIEKTKIKGEYFYSNESREVFSKHMVNPNNNLIVAVAAEDIDGKMYLKGLKKLLLWTFTFTAILSVITGFLFSKAMLRPLAGIINEVKLVSSNNLSQRIHIGSKNDELQQLSKTFNELLDKIEESFVIQRRFISNASHELSTPLTSVSSQLEVTLQKDRTDKEYKEVIQSIYEDIKDLQQLTRSLLDIAKSGSQGSIELTEVRLDEILIKVASDVQKAEKANSVQLNFETLPEDEQLLTVFGNANLLYIAFKNIVENGCKYSDNNSAIISVSFKNHIINVAIKSMGDIITESEIQNVFQPFFRTESVKHKQGFGLGLTLTKRILALHKSQIDVISNPIEGTIFTVSLPNTLKTI